MRVLQFNVLYGCRTENRLMPFSRWMEKQDYDVVGFNELNGWTGESFQQEAEKWGFSHTCLFEMKTSPFFIGVAAKSPVQQIDADESLFYHGLLHVKVEGVHFFITHFPPIDSNRREEEAAEVVRRIRSVHGPVVLMGDLNTLSPLDHHQYKQSGAIETFLTTDYLSRQYVQDGVINYRPMQILLDAGLSDAGFNDSLDYSFPTPLKHKPKPEIKRRIDYVLVNDILRRRNPVANVIRNTEVEKLSDHYPIECRWGDAR